MDDLPATSWSAEPERTVVDGVPVVWLPGPAPLTAGLCFHAGPAVEGFHQHGVTHLVEHLALSRIGRTPYEYNGMVEPRSCTFLAWGTGSEVAGFLRSVCDALQDLPVDRLETEKRVLWTESLTGGAGVVGELLGLRFGAKGFGALAYPELGLRRLTSGEVTDWTARRFVRDNAMLWLSGQPPDDLTLPLPAGEPASAAEIKPVSVRALPARAVVDGVGVVASMIGSRASPAMRMALSIASKRSFDDLRAARGITYSINELYDPLSTDLVHTVLGGDCQVEDAAEVAAGLLHVLRALAADGPTEEELAAEADAFRRVLTDPAAIPGFLNEWAQAALHGAPTYTPSEILSMMQSVSSADAAGAVEEGLRSLILGIPEEAMDRVEELPPYETVDEDPIRGEVHRPVGLTTKRLVRIEVDDSGVSVYQGSESATVKFARCVGVLTGEDGGLTLVQDDGFALEVNPNLLTRGSRLRAAILEALPGSLFIPMEAGAVAQHAVDGAAARFLTRRWSVLSELDTLRGVLEEDEEILTMAEATLENRAGLLTVTDRRLVFLATPTVLKARRMEKILERSFVAEAQIERGALLVSTRSGFSMRFKDVVPSERMGDLIQHLGSAAHEGEAGLRLRHGRPLLFAGVAHVAIFSTWPFLAIPWALGAAADVVALGGLGKRVQPPLLRWLNRGAIAGSLSAMGLMLVRILG